MRFCDYEYLLMRMVTHTALCFAKELDIFDGRMYFLKNNDAQNFMEKLKTFTGGFTQCEGYSEINGAIETNNRCRGSFSYFICPLHLGLDRIKNLRNFGGF